MSDPKATPSATVCDIEDCHALIPVALEDRRAHRLGHKHRDKVDEALRSALKDAHNQLRAITTRLTDLERDVAGIEIPDPVEPFEIVNAEDLEPLDDDELDDETSPPQPNDDDEDDAPRVLDSTIATQAIPTNYFSVGP